MKRIILFLLITVPLFGQVTAKKAVEDGRATHEGLIRWENGSLVLRDDTSLFLVDKPCKIKLRNVSLNVAAPAVWVDNLLFEVFSEKWITIEGNGQAIIEPHGFIAEPPDYDPNTDVAIDSILFIEKPDTLIVKKYDSGVVFYWDKNRESDLSGYIVNILGDTLILSDFFLSDTSMDVQKPLKGLVEFRILAIDSTGNKSGTTSKEFFFIRPIQIDQIPPNIPTGVKATESNQTVIIIK